MELDIIEWCDADTSRQRHKMINKIVNTFRSLGVSRAACIPEIHKMVVASRVQYQLDNLIGLA